MVLSKQTKITDYRPDKGNPNKHNQRGVSMLEDSLATVGLGRSIVVDKNGIVLAGNSTQQQAVDAGFEDAIEIETSGDTMVVVRRTDLDLLSLTDTKARALSYFDNRSAEIGVEWNAEQLLADVNAGIDFSRMFNDSELNALLESVRDLDGDQSERGLTPDERLDIFMNATIKQIVLYFGNDEYEAIVKRFAAVRSREQVESNTEAVVKLLEFYEQHTGTPD